MPDSTSPPAALRRLRHALLPLVLAGLLAGCSTSGSDGSTAEADEDTSTSSTAASTTVRPSAPATAAAIPCPAELPADPRVTCSTVTVPTDRAEPDSPPTDLFVAVIAGTNRAAAPDPVIYLSGGPGGTGVTEGRVQRYLTSDPTGGRDVVLFDQRGTGRSAPDLACPEVSDAAFGVLESSTPRSQIAAEQLADAFRACHSRLVADEVDVSSVNSEISADDVDDIRRALGYERANLFGVSYGTTVALEVLRRHPDGVRSAVLDSVLSTTSPDTPDNLADRLLSGRRALFDGCEADPACAEAYPDLDGTLQRVVERFDATPHTVHTDAVGDVPARTVQITGADVAAGLIRAQYDPEYIPSLPGIIASLDRGETAIIDVLAASGLDFWLGLAPGDAVSVECADRQDIDGPVTLQDQLDVIDAHPDLALFLSAASLLGNCEFWKVPSVSEAFRTPVHSDVPVLVFAGTFDPIIPPGASQEVAEQLGNATFVQIPDGGHGEVYSSDCATSLFTTFLADPDTTLDTACVAAIAPPAWQVG